MKVSKYNLSVIKRALANSYSHYNGDLTCCLLSENDGTKEREFYSQIFEIWGMGLFSEEFNRFYNRYPTDGEIKEIRLIALSFLHEICRLENKGEEFF
jgi:hypothetical protein